MIKKKYSILLLLLILQVLGEGSLSLERRILEVNRKRVKVVKPGSKTSFPTTEIRGSYAPPFHVSLCLNFNNFVYTLLTLFRGIQYYSKLVSYHDFKKEFVLGFHSV
jgi:hypothetical protein